MITIPATCPHDDEDAYVLAAGNASVRFCRDDDCQAWTLTLADETVTGFGLTDYHAAFDSAVDQIGWSASLRFLRGLGGHEHEVGRFPDPDSLVDAALEPVLKALDEALAGPHENCAYLDGALERMHREVLARRVRRQIDRLEVAVTKAPRSKLAAMFLALDEIPAARAGYVLLDGDIPF